MSLPNIKHISGYGGSQPVIPLGAPGSGYEMLYESGNIFYEAGDIGKEYKTILCGHPAVGWEIHGTERLFYVYSSNGINWSTPLEIITNGISDGLEDPYVVKVGGLYYLYAELKPSDQSSQVDIVCYTSPDLVAWTARGSVIIPGSGWESYSVSSPAVIYEDGIFKMLYEGRSSATEFQTGLATSTDGIVFTKSGSNPVIKYSDITWGDGTVPDDIVKNDGIYYAVIHTFNASWTGRKWRGGMYSSPDLISWTDMYGMPLTCDEGSPIPNLLIVDNNLLTWYHFSNSEGKYGGKEYSLTILKPQPVIPPVIIPPEIVPPIIPKPTPEPTPPGLNITLSAAVIATALEKIDNSGDFCDALAKVIIKNLNVQITPGAIIRQVVGGSYTPAIGYPNTQPIILEVK